MAPKVVSFVYLNHKGVKAKRTVDFECIEFIQHPGFDYQPGWFMSGRCHDHNLRRSFALNRIILPEDEHRLSFTLVK